MRASIFSHCPHILRRWLVQALVCACALSSARWSIAQAPPQGSPTAPDAKKQPAKPEDAPVRPGQSHPKQPSPSEAGKTDSEAAEAAGPSQPKSEAAEAAGPSQPTPSQGGPSEAGQQAAKEALEKGMQSYQAGDYVTAAAHFTSSLQLAPSPQAQFWYAMALDLQGKATEAVEAFEALFQSPQHTQLPPEQLEPARQRYDVLKKIPATVLLHVTPPQAQLSVDGQQQQGKSPYSLKLAAGTHRLRLNAEGFETVETELSVKPAQTLEQAVELKPLPTTKPATEPQEPQPQTIAPPPKPRSKVPAYVTLGVAGAGAVVGTIFGIQALNAKSDFDDQRTVDAADEVERNALIADMAFGIAITLGITGVVLLTSDEPVETARDAAPRQKAKARSKLEVAPYFSPNGGGAAARAIF